MPMKKKLGIYIHIPFCLKKCAYCDFLSFPLNEKSGLVDGYLNSLYREIEESAVMFPDYKVDTIFFGGGTPSVVDPNSIKHCLDIVFGNYCVSDDVEISMEINPKTASKEKFLIYKEAKVNRLSIGLQSGNEDELQMLGRLHSYEDFLNTYKWAKQTEFKNLNVDIISGIPKQTIGKLESTLERVLELDVQHISVYSLIVEPETPFYDWYGPEGTKKSELIDDEQDLALYNKTKQMLYNKGFESYEISNYAKPSFACRHNLKYWNMDEYVGFGLGSSSLYGSVRYKNTSVFEKYIGNPFQTFRDVEEKLSLQDGMTQYIYLGLRKTEGVNKEDFYKRYHLRFEEEYKSIIDKYKAQNLMGETEKFVFLEEKAVWVSNQIMVDFLPD